MKDRQVKEAGEDLCQTDFTANIKGEIGRGLPSGTSLLCCPFGQIHVQYFLETCPAAGALMKPSQWKMAKMLNDAQNAA